MEQAKPILRCIFRSSDKDIPRFIMESVRSSKRIRQPVTKPCHGPLQRNTKFCNLYKEMFYGSKSETWFYEGRELSDKP